VSTLPARNLRLDLYAIDFVRVLVSPDAPAMIRTLIGFWIGWKHGAQTRFVAEMR
jgi:hypothetical protein